MAKKINVLIVPAGSGMAVAAIDSLRQDKDIKVVSADCDKLAAGLYLSHKGYIIPAFKDEKFWPSINKIIKKEKINVIIPALDPILMDFSQRKAQLEENKVKVLVSDTETIKITRDKWETYKKLEGVVPLPKSFIYTLDVDMPFPLFIKPRAGSGSKWAYRADSAEDLDFYFKKIENPIIQEYLPGKEYTVDCLADEKGKLAAVICRERFEIKNGITTKGKIVKNKEVEDIARTVSEKIPFSGPFFFQVKEDASGKPRLIEINARIAGTMSLSSYSGVNIHALAVRMAMGEKVKIGKIKYGLAVTRYSKDIYLSGKKNKNIYHA